MVAAAEKQTTYYTRPTTERNAQPVDAAEAHRFAQTRSMRKLIEGVSAPFITNATSVVNGESTPLSALDPDKRRSFDATIEQVAYERVRDLFTPEGKMPDSNFNEWNNVLQIAPEIVSIMLDDKNYIDAVSQENAANIVRFGIDVARNPEILERTLLNTGFGGSDSPFTSSRFDVYSFPALKISRGLRNLYDRREAEALGRTQVNKLFDEKLEEFEQTFGKRPEKQEKAAINAAVKALDSNDLPSLTDEEILVMKKDYAIPASIPTVRFFFAAGAASGINHTMDPEGIRIRTDENAAALRESIDTTFPDVADSVEIIEDVPWEKHSRATQLMIEYCAKLLRESDDPNIQRVLQRLEKQGGQHGGDNGEEMAAEYAAIHPFIFQDALDLPFARFLGGVSKPPLVNITIGGRPEKQFNHLREYLSTHVSADGYIRFIDDKITSSDDEDNARELAKIRTATVLWKEKMDAVRSEYTANMDYGAIPRSDLPFMTIRLITSLADSPSYYLTPFDQPRGINIEDQVAQLRQSDEDIDDLMLQQMLAEEKTPEAARAELKTVKAGVLFDLQAILREKEMQETVSTQI